MPEKLPCPNCPGGVMEQDPHWPGQLVCTKCASNTLLTCPECGKKLYFHPAPDGEDDHSWSCECGYTE